MNDNTSIRSLATRLNAMQPRFEELQNYLLNKFGDEGHDIGDAAQILELIANTCIDVPEEGEPHDSYTVFQMRDEIAAFYNMSRPDFRRLCDDLNGLKNRQWVALHRRIS